MVLVMRIRHLEILDLFGFRFGVLGVGEGPVRMLEGARGVPVSSRIVALFVVFSRRAMFFGGCLVVLCCLTM